MKLAIAATREQVEILSKSERVNGSREVLSALLANAHLRPDEVGAVKEKLSAFPGARETPNRQECRIRSRMPLSLRVMAEQTRATKS